MVKVTIEMEGKDPVVLEGAGLIGSFIVRENEDGSVDCHDTVIGMFNLNMLTAGLHNTITAYMGELKRNGFSDEEITTLANIAMGHSKSTHEVESSK